MLPNTPYESQRIPSIRLINATPSAAGNSEPNSSIDLARVAPWAAQPTQPLSLGASSLRNNKPKIAPLSDGNNKKRLAPKKSKLGLLSQRLPSFNTLNGGKENANAGSTRGHTADYSLHGDSTHDPDLGEIVMIKKKKSRAALDAVNWDNALGEVSTNVPKRSKETSKKEKEDKKEDKWWSTIAYGKGRKDSKEKEKTLSRAPSPEPTLERSRFNSLDSSAILQPASNDEPKRAIRGRVSSAQLLTIPPPAMARSSSDAPRPSNQFLAPPSHLEVELPSESAEGNTGSVAFRAMRSVRSLARMASWNQLKDAGSDEPEKESIQVKSGTISKKDKKPKDKKSKDKPQTVRMSSSSFEAGALSPSPQPSPAPQSQTLGHKKSRILTLGLGLPSTVRLPGVRSGSNASSVLLSPPTSYQPMVTTVTGRDRSGSGTSSIRPASTLTNSSGGSSRLSASSYAPSTMSRLSSSSTGSVRWDEDRLQTIKERRLQERKEKSEQDAREGKTAKRDSHDSRNPRRTSLADVFPETASASSSRPVSMTSSLEVPSNVGHVGLPLLTLETATNDGHSTYSRSSTETPIKRPRPRPMSDQMLMNRDKLRPKGIQDGEVLSMLDAATNELALLVNNLDLEATPATPDMTPLKPSPYREDGSLSEGKSRDQDSPLQKKGNGLRPVSSLRAALRVPPSSVNAQSLGQHIAPWKVLNSQFSPAKSPVKKTTPTAKFRLTHKRTLTPSPAPEPLPVFQPLQPASRRVTPIGQQKRESVMSTNSCHVPSMLTFGSRPSSQEFDNETETDEEFINRNATIKRARYPRSSTESVNGLPKMGKETKRRLGMSGTLGGSAGSDYVPEDLNPSDPDSDIPDELQIILGGQNIADADMEDTLSFTSPLGAPPRLPLPNFDAHDSDTDEFTDYLPTVVISHPDTLHQDDEPSSPSDEEDTKKSFDFTGEIKKLNESGASDRASFVEQLENAFRTPAKIDLRYALDFLRPKDIPPVPKLPFEFPKTVSVEALRLTSEEPTVLAGSDSFASSSELYSGEDVSMTDGELQVPLRNKSSAKSTGELNREFKFGGKSPSPSLLAPSPYIHEEKHHSTLTLSDIIPSPAHARSISLGEDVSNDSALKSIFAVANEDMPSERMMPPTAHRRVNSDSNVKQISKADIARRSVYDDSRSNRSSIASFSGLGESFDEVRRGFEFHDNRPGFYPPSANVSKCWSQSHTSSHIKQDSMFSFVSVSSYGRVVNPGVPDPFEYGAGGMGLTSLRERPSSEEMSLSMTVDDTFSFVKHGSQFQPRQRVDSDASSFYFRAPAPRGAAHRRRESNMSVSSLAPPISLYNRSYGNARHSHRRDESSSSFSSLAHNYAVYGATGGRDVWAKHQRDASVDSVMSDFSAMRLGRPGIGDKMFDNGNSNGSMPFNTIAASPGTSIDECYDNERRESSYDPRESMYDQRVSMYDSIMDGSQDQRLSMQDSLFEQTGYRSSMMSSDESVFGGDLDSKFHQAHPQLRYRPISVASLVSEHDPVRDEDTMITMIGGGHVRRMSVSSAVDASPCARKRKHNQSGSPIDLFFDSQESPKKARIIEAKPSITSTSSLKFGDERMIKATKGLLERQSLEDTCLVGSGEDKSMSFHSIPVFSRPRPGARSRSSTCTSSSSGRDTPPLSCSDGSSQSGGSQSSIDLSSIDTMLVNVTHPVSTTSRIRARARGRGHKRFSQVHMSRSSVYETIDEEGSQPGSPAADSTRKYPSPTVGQAVYIADADSVSLNGSVIDETVWDNEGGIENLRKYYALREEAQDTVQESKRTWMDTPFSTFALQSFAMPAHPTGMQALLEHSQQNYGPLPSELRPRRIRSRTSSRASPYIVPVPVRAAIKRSPSPTNEQNVIQPMAPLPLQPVHVNHNIPQSILEQGKVFIKKDPTAHPDLNKWGLPRPRVPSGARRVALGWSKRSAGAKTSTATKSSTGLKENAPPKSSTGLKENSAMGMTPSQTLRVNRPRPKGRPTPASNRPRPLAIYN